MSLGERCDACGSTTALSAVPRIEIESLDMVPFSESFSGLFDGGDHGDVDEDEDDDEDDESNEDSVDNDNERHMKTNEMSYNVEQFSDVKDLDPEWDDDDVEEVMVVSPKQSYSKLPTISEERDTFSIASNEVYCSQALPQTDRVVTRADFDIIPSSGYPIFCRKRSTNKVYVTKAFQRCTTREQHIERVVMEVICTLRAPFLERVHWTFPGVEDGEEGRIYFVLESYPGGTLTELMNPGSIAPADALFYICEVVEGLSSLHTANIIHRDLTPSNICIDHTGHVVLTNFCNATLLSPDEQRLPPSATAEYQAPEILLGWAHDFAVDCWSFGVLLHLLLASTNPVVNRQDDTVRNQILDGCPVLSGSISLEAKDLIIKCLERNPALRLSIARIREHDYFAAVDWYGVQYKNILPPTRSPLSPKLRPTSQDFPLPPTSRISQSIDTSLDISFTLHTASKAVPSQPRLERVHGRETVTDTRLFRPTSSMDDLRSKIKAQRFSLPSRSVSAAPLRDRLSMQDVGTSLGDTAAMAADPFHPFSPRLSLQIQTPDSLPKIFRSTVLDDRLVEEEEPCHPSPTISSPTVCELSPRERMAQFWETLDAEEDRMSGSSVPSLELRDAIKLALPCPPLPISRPRRLRKRSSSLALPLSHPDHRFSMLSVTQVTTNKLRKLRRPLSNPFMSKRSEIILNLPPGVEQIGRGIGFTYKIPLASHSKASICSTAAPSAASQLLRNGLGLGKGFLRRPKSQPKFSPVGVAGRHGRGPPARILTSPGITSMVAPELHSPVSDGPLTPDSITFPPLPEIGGDPFAKDDLGDEARPEPTLRLVPVSSPDYRLPFSPTMQPLDNFIFSNWNPV